MMPKDKRITYFLALFTSELLLTFLIITVINKRTILNSAWLSPKFYVFQFSAFFQIGNSLIRAHDSAACFVRYGSRRKLNLRRVAQSSVLALCMTGILMLFCAVGFFAAGSYGAAGTAVRLLSACIRFFIGLLILAELTVILSMSRFRRLRSCPGLAAFVLLTLELLVAVPQINHFTDHDIWLIFSWVFPRDRLTGFAVLTVIAAGLLAYILCAGNRKDLCI